MEPDTPALRLDAYHRGQYGWATLFGGVSVADAGIGIVTFGASARLNAGIRSVLLSNSELGGVEGASKSLIEAVSKRRTVTWATPGSDAERFLNFRGAEAATFVGTKDILLRPNPSKAAVLEEFLHGTQYRLGIVERLGTSGLGSAETHVKDFMIRHANMLGLGVEDVKRLQILRDRGF